MRRAIASTSYNSVAFTKEMLSERKLAPYFIEETKNLYTRPNLIRLIKLHTRNYRKEKRVKVPELLSNVVWSKMESTPWVVELLASHVL